MSQEERREIASIWDAAPSGLIGLCRALSGRMTEALQYVELDTKTGRRAPEVIGGWLPPKGDAEVERFPFVIVRPRRGADSQQGGDEVATAAIEIIVGTYSDTDNGWWDVAHVIDTIRADIGAAPSIEGTAFEHVGPLTWEIPEQQQRPQWFGNVISNWIIPRPERVTSSTEGF